MSETWRGRRERGSRGAIRLIIWLALHVGRPVCRFLLLPICAYFLLTAPLQRRASIEFLARAMRRRARLWDVFNHLRVFATTLLDRVYLLHGRRDKLAISVSNESVFWNAMDAGRGCLLLGSHLGSFEMLGVIGSEEKKLTINMVMHVDEDAQLARLIISNRDRNHQGGNDLPYRIIPLGHPESMLRVRDCLARGEVVGILADRVFADEPTEVMPFLGKDALFTLSPLRLARITGAPVVTVFGLYEGGNRYQIHFEPEAFRVTGSSVVSGTPMADSIAKAVSLHEGLSIYVASLERQAIAHPTNWFNFYSYWSH